MSKSRQIDLSEKNGKEDLSETKEHIFDVEDLFDPHNEKKTFDPAQDFSSGHLSYGLMYQDELFLINSENEITIPSQNENMQPTTENLQISHVTSGVMRRIKSEEDVSANEIFCKIRDYIKDHVYYQSSAVYQILSLWIMGTYVFKIFDSYPYIWLNGPMSSGKSLLIDVLEPIVFNGHAVSGITATALFKTVHYNNVTLIIDEAEKFGSKESNSDIKCLLNRGYRKNSKVTRCSGGNKIESYNSYGPKLLACINQVDPVLASRCILIKSVKKSEAVKLKRLRPGTLETLHEELRGDQYVFAMRNASKIHDTYLKVDDFIEIPAFIANRDLDLFEPLLCIAHIIDEENGNSQLHDAVIDYAKMNHTLQEIERTSANERAQLLVVLNDFRENNQAIKIVNQTEYHCAKQVFEFFQSSEEFSHLQSRNWLSHKLKNQFGIESKQVRIGGEKPACYLIDPEKLEISQIENTNENI